MLEAFARDLRAGHVYAEAHHTAGQELHLAPKVCLLHAVWHIFFLSARALWPEKMHVTALRRTHLFVAELVIF